MSECYRYIYLQNENLKSSESFKDSYIRNGISLYEVIRIISGKAVFLEEHYARLCNSAKQINVNIWYDFPKFKNCIQILTEKNDVQEGNIKLVFNIKEKQKNFFAYFIKHSYPDNELYKNGIRTIIHQAERSTPTAKIYNHELRSRTNNLIQEAEIFEVILLDSLGNITEGSRSNLFFVKDNTLYTAPDDKVLHGIVRGKVITIAEKLHINICKEAIKFSELDKYESAFLTGTSPMILPIKTINAINFSVSHPILNRILSEYKTMIKENLL
ncbi:aminotransferase class IV [Marinifilum sp. RC60d5]|uniref:aminotransferase class IV n=1 Tax=Marinifilum sp. RC60d5 TaxID=3458414 RepID=UPI00403633D8